MSQPPGLPDCSFGEPRVARYETTHSDYWEKPLTERHLKTILFESGNAQPLPDAVSRAFEQLRALQLDPARGCRARFKQLRNPKPRVQGFCRFCESGTRSNVA